MKKEQIHLWDLKRILFGQAPPGFMIEVFIRAVVVYLIAVVVVRWMGKRMNGQYSIIELAVMVMMGAIVALPMQVPERGILQGALVLLVTLLLLRGTNLLGFRNEKIEKRIQGDVLVLVKDGVLQKDAPRSTRLTNQQLFEILRSKSIYNLGLVKRMYVEAYGLFSVYSEEEPRPGLPIYPQIDQTILKGFAQLASGRKAYTYCGHTEPESAAVCDNCGDKSFTRAVI